MKGFSFDVDDPSYVCIWMGSMIEFDLFRICATNQYYSKCEAKCVLCTSKCSYCSAFGCGACEFYVVLTETNTTMINDTNPAANNTNTTAN